ncbi:MAG TPA: NUDIX domain-containing protein, partial [Ferroplasma sp.]|nr:NUDIX domain-containing protein [Ferroplasma sp.]
MECMAAVALILNGNKFLLIKRADQEGDPWSGHMALPGGHRENG